MEFKKEQELISDIIDRELYVEFEKYFEHMEEKEMESYQKKVDTVIGLTEILKSKLNKEDIKLLINLVDTCSAIGLQESRYFFERGVRCGLTTLNYLKKYYDYF